MTSPLPILLLQVKPLIRLRETSFLSFFFGLFQLFVKIEDAFSTLSRYPSCLIHFHKRNVKKPAHKITFCNTSDIVLWKFLSCELLFCTTLLLSLSSIRPFLLGVIPHVHWAAFYLHLLVCYFVKYILIAAVVFVFTSGIFPARELAVEWA